MTKKDAIEFALWEEKRSGVWIEEIGGYIQRRSPLNIQELKNQRIANALTSLTGEDWYQKITDNPGMFHGVSFRAAVYQYQGEENDHA